MKTIVAFAALFALALAKPAQRPYYQQQRAVQVQPQTAAAPIVVAPVSYQSQQASASSPQYAYIVKELPQNNIGLGGYQFAFETSDGQKRDETADIQIIRAARSDEEPTAITRVKGSYSYIGDDGQTYTVTYVADENGFQPSGAHLPVAPVA